MGQTHMILAGLEPGYMKKLALYIKTYRNDVDEISIIEEGSNYGIQKGGNASEAMAGHRKQGKGDLCILAGSRKVIEDAKEDLSAEENRIFIVLYTDPPDACEGAIYAYQSADVICREIFCRIKDRSLTSASGGIVRTVQWLIVTGTVSRGDLLPFAVTCAQLCAAGGETLLLNLCGISGMNRMFELEPPGMDLTDLIIDGRKGEARIESYTGRIGEIAYVPPADNPAILYEITPDDLEHLITMVEEAGTFDTVVVMLGDLFPGCAQLFHVGAKVFCLTGLRLPELLQKEELYRFFCRNKGKVEKWEDVMVNPQNITTTGPHLLYEWMQGELGDLVRNVLNGQMGPA